MKCLIAIMLVSLFLIHCSKDPKVDLHNNIVIKGAVTDSVTGQPVRGVIVSCINEYSWDFFNPPPYNSNPTQTSCVTDENGQFYLDLHKGDIKSDLRLLAEGISGAGKDYNVASKEYTFPVDLVKDTIVHDLKVRLDYRTKIDVRLEYDPNLKIHFPSGNWMCVADFLGEHHNTTFPDNLTVDHPRDTFNAPEYATKCYISWMLRIKNNGKIFYTSPVDSMPLVKGVYNQYVIYY